jgi:hypothetical protein
MRTLFTSILILLLMSCSNRHEIFMTENGAAIDGYDPVAYFIKQRPLKGVPDFQVYWKGATWNFSSAENKAAFMMNPDRFAPQYGGYCAYGVSNGYKAPTDPLSWTIVNDRLYLNYNSDVREEWFSEKEARIKKGDANWIEVKEERFE